jgi:hypothetical protein
MLPAALGYQRIAVLFFIELDSRWGASRWQHREPRWSLGNPASPSARLDIAPAIDASSLPDSGSRRQIHA